jgi:hypothetical protein
MPPTVIPWFIAIVLPEWTRSPAMLHRMALWCMRFTPRVHVEDVERSVERAQKSSRLPHAMGIMPTSLTPHGLPASRPSSLPTLIVLDVSGCLRVNGGAHRVVARVKRGLTRRGIVHAIGSAPSSGQAVVQAMGVALGCRPVLDELPFECLRLSDSICAALREVNLTRIGEARAIARSALADRYGPELGERLDMAAGVRAWPFRAIAPPDPVVGEFVFASPCAQQEAVDLACMQAVEFLCAALASAGNASRNEDGSVRAPRIGCAPSRGVRTLEVRIERARLAPVIGTIYFGAPTREARHLWSILRPRIQRMHLGDHERGEGVERILLTAARMGRCQSGTPFLSGAVGMAAAGTHKPNLAHGGSGGDRNIDTHSKNDHHAATERAIGEFVDQLRARLGNDVVQRAHA